MGLMACVKHVVKRNPRRVLSLAFLSYLLLATQWPDVFVSRFVRCAVVGGLVRLIAGLLRLLAAAARAGEREGRIENESAVRAWQRILAFDPATQERERDAADTNR